MSQEDNCPTCGARVRIVGNTTMHYEPVDELTRLRGEVERLSDPYEQADIAASAMKKQADQIASLTSQLALFKKALKAQDDVEDYDDSHQDTPFDPVEYGKLKMAAFKARRDALDAERGRK